MSSLSSPESDFEALGGAEGVQRLITLFVDRVASDFIIGFFFERVDLNRVKKMEANLACIHLGGPGEYVGRPVGKAHSPYPINAGHFRRRLAILRTVLTEQGVDPEIIARWLAHDQTLQGQVTNGQECAP
ncbi:MAG: hemoglobin [Cognaticolwellia sp.]|jgi:hemoglobin